MSKLLLFEFAESGLSTISSRPTLTRTFKLLTDYCSKTAWLKANITFNFLCWRLCQRFRNTTQSRYGVQHFGCYSFQNYENRFNFNLQIPIHLLFGSRQRQRHQHHRSRQRTMCLVFGIFALIDLLCSRPLQITYKNHKSYLINKSEVSFSAWQCWVRSAFHNTSVFVVIK